MTTQPVQPYPTRFGMFAPCDKETYRKLKRIRHLAGFAEAERRRWDRAQRRLPHNRAFKRRRCRVVTPEPVDERRMLFAPFFAPQSAAPSSTDSKFNWPPDARLTAATELHARFLRDYQAARHPRPEPQDVRPLSLTPPEIDALLEQIELWNLQR